MDFFCHKIIFPYGIRKLRQLILWLFNDTITAEGTFSQRVGKDL
jgi:hypothetical protein